MYPRCPNPKSCEGGGLCRKGFGGDWCGSCTANWFFVSPQCFECPSSSWLLVVAALFGFLGIAYVIVAISTSRGPSNTRSILQEVAATPMSIMFTRIQISITVFTLDLKWPQWLINFIDLVKLMVSLDVTAMTAPECFVSGQQTADPAAMFIVKSGFKFFLFPILCVTMVGVYKFQLSRMPPQEAKDMPRYPINSMVAAWTFLFIMLVTSGFSPFDCKVVRGQVCTTEYWLSILFSATCPYYAAMFMQSVLIIFSAL